MVPWEEPEGTGGSPGQLNTNVCIGSGWGGDGMHVGLTIVQIMVLCPFPHLLDEETEAQGENSRCKTHALTPQPSHLSLDTVSLLPLQALSPSRVSSPLTPELQPQPPRAAAAPGGLGIQTSSSPWRMSRQVSDC